MINEANGTPSHRDMIKIIERTYIEGGFDVATEHTLTNGKRADLVVVTRNDEIHVIEVKTRLWYHLLTSTWQKYSGFAHRLWLAIPTGDPGLRLDPPEIINWINREDLIGLMTVSWEGLRIARPARLLHEPPLNAAITRKRVRKTVATGGLAS